MEELGDGESKDGSSWGKWHGAAKGKIYYFSLRHFELTSR